MKGYVKLVESIDQVEGAAKRLRRLFTFHRALERFVAKHLPTEYNRIRRKHFGEEGRRLIEPRQKHVNGAEGCPHCKILHVRFGHFQSSEKTRTRKAKQPPVVHTKHGVLGPVDCGDCNAIRRSQGVHAGGA